MGRRYPNSAFMDVTASRKMPDMGEWGIWALLAAGLCGALILLPEFRTSENLVNVLRQSAVLALIAIGQTFVILAGMIDLSVGMIAGLVVVLACWMLGENPDQTMLVVPAMLALGIAIGLVNGLLVRWLKLHPLILTFGMLSVLQGVIFTFTDRSVGRASEELRILANGEFYGIPYSAILIVLLVVISQFILSRTRFGFHLLAAGGDEDSARKAGINTGRLHIAAFALAGGFAAAGGLVLAGRLGTGYPLAGSGLELDSIVAVVLGGALLSGGRGNLVNTIAGVLALSLISNLLNLFGVSAFVQMFAKGLIVVIAILINQPRKEVR